LPQIGPLEILVILIVALVVFGPSKLPQIGRQVGRGFREFRKFQAGLRDDIEDAFREDDEDDDVDDEHDDEPKQLEAGRPESAGAESRQPDPGKRTEPPPADTTS
jgi:sec-independent protein translocase protein TatA